MVGIIIQARMGSTRLPGKILRDFGGKTLLDHIVTRLRKKLTSNAEIVIATSVLEQDDAVEAFCHKHEIKCFRGDEQNVLSRYYLCAKQNGYDDIVRMTGDNPFPDIEELNRLIDYHVRNKMDFTENFSTLPIGVGMEIFSYDALKISMERASLPKHFEHADEYILDNLDAFRHMTLQNVYSKAYCEERLTVDTPEDYKKACYIISNAHMDYITTDKAVELSKKYTSIEKGN